ncbi:MAG TPA: hypothetical protein VKB93_22780 [Thermoanaerobaculia bacterium]|nr:hypothetical protein [Thermoanaerobaculia bacterium]
MNATPRFRDVVLEQIRIVGLSFRIVALVVAVVLAVGTFAIIADILGGGPGFDSSETLPTPLFSFLIPFAVWRHDRPFEPAFLWTLPVDRRRLALAKVFAGWVWMMALLGVVAAWVFVLSLIAHAPALLMVLRIPVIATIATYLFGSAFVLGVRHPLRWLLGAAGVSFLTKNLTESYRMISAPFENTAAHWHTLPGALTAILLLGAGLAALWAAASRHKETR